MLVVFGMSKGSRLKVGEFNGYRAYADFIGTQETLWKCTVYTADSLKEYYKIKRPERITLPEFRAMQLGVGLLELRYGDNRPVRQIVCTPDVDQEEMIKDWVENYAKYNGYTIFKLGSLPKTIKRPTLKLPKPKQELPKNNSKISIFTQKEV